jgi:hypothetical protein
MRKVLMLLAATCFIAVPVFSASTSYKNVSLVDVNCSGKVADNPDAHTRACAIQCEKSGYGILTNDKKFVKFDADGNAKISEQLKASTQKDHLRVDVKGEMEGDTLKVTSVKLHS